jgi:hypothetical protein
MQVDATSTKPLSDEAKVQEIESLLRKTVKSKTLTDEAYNYMALLITEDCPKNQRELSALVGDFLSDGMCYNEEESVKLC